LKVYCSGTEIPVIWLGKAILAGTKKIKRS
jgi:hypothetical protein